MRVTNQMVTNNTMLYLNNTQSNMLDIQQQLTTGKKIGKPSDDPIVAVRALKLKTDVSEINQYSRNVDDATSWIDVTEQALTNMTDMYKRIRELTVQGSSGTYTYEDHVKMLEEIKQLNEQLAHEGNVTYAGRHIFSGFKTNTPLIYTEDVTRRVKIEEEYKSSDMDIKTIAYDDATSGHPVSEEVYRIRLSYDQLDSAAPPVFNNVPAAVGTLSQTTMTSTDANAYNPPAGQVNFLKDTGELIFNSDDAKHLKNASDFSIDIAYEKTNFETGDQVPDHYYKAEVYQTESINKNGGNIKVANIPVVDGSVTLTDSGSNNVDVFSYFTGTIDPTTIPDDEVAINKDTGEVIFSPTTTVPNGLMTVDYRSSVDGTIDQNMEYEISIGQTIDVNTLGKDVLTTESLRDLEELINNIEYSVSKINEYEDQIEVVKNDSTLTEEEKQDKIDDLEASKRVYSDQINKYYDQMTTKVDNEMKQLANETAVVGSKANRLELTSNRLEDDNINFTDLLSKTEDIDMTETIIELQSNQVVYNASLMATSEIVQQSLIDFLR